MKLNRSKSPPILTSALLVGVSLLAARANDWNAGVGDWSNAANWNGGVPNNAGGWAIGNVANGGTAIITNTVPNVSEAWAGNNGAAGNITVAVGGTLNVDNWLVAARNGGAGNTPLSLLRVDGGTVNKRGDGFLIGEPGGCRGELHITGNGIVNVTGGWFGVGNNGGWGWIYLRDNAQLLLSEGRDFNIGDYGSPTRGWCYMQDNARIDVRRFWVGKNDTEGVMVQSGGIVQGYTPGNEWRIGENANAYGFYEFSGGTFNNPNNFQIGATGKGLWYQSGGTATLSGWTAPGRYSGGWGVIYLTGGSIIHNGTGPHLIIGEQGRGELSVSGSSTLNCNLSLVVSHGYNGLSGTGILNLNGGTTLIPYFERWGTGTGFVNLNGGTISPKADNANFMNGLNEATVFAGNAIFDTASYDVTVAQALVAPSGDGVISIPVTDGGAGYIGAPIVQIDASGAGSGATAVAQVDRTSGKVTGITVTCSGYGYAGAPNVTLLGGGASTPATLGAATIGAVTSGGVVKKGEGVLTLTGPSTYTGTSVAQGGTLMLSTDYIGGGAGAASDGAAIGVKVNAMYGQLNLSGLTLGTTTGAALDFDLGTFGNPVNAPLNVFGTVTANGPVTVNVAATLLQVGRFTLLQYASKAGSGSFVLGTLPSGVEATLINDTANNKVDLNITSVGLPRWDGTVTGGVWDIGTTPNWIEQSTGLATTYNDGAPVLFNDDALGTTNVNLVATVKPNSITVSNMSLAYVIGGSGKISGTSGLVKQGDSSLTIGTANDYTGKTIVAGGTLYITNLANGGSASAIGKSSSSPTNLVLSGGTLSYSGAPVVTDRGFTVSGAVGTLDAQANMTFSGRMAGVLGGGFRKAGLGKLSYTGAVTNELSGNGWPGYNVALGTVVFDGSAGTQVNHNQGELWIGGGVDGNSTMVLTNTTLNVDSWVAVARGNGTVGNTSSLEMYNSVLRSGGYSMGYDGGIFGNLSYQFLTMNGNSAITNGGDMNLAESAGSTTTMLLKDNSVLYSGWRVHLGWHSGAVGTMTLANSSKLAINAWFSLGNEGGTGTLTMKDNSSAWVLWDFNVTDVNTGDATFNIQDNAVVSANNYFIGKGVGSTGRVHQVSGSVVGLDSGNEFQIGFHGEGTWNLSGGSIVAPNHWFVVGRFPDGPGTFNMTGGSLLHTSAGKYFRVGEEGTGVFNLSGTGYVQDLGDNMTIGSTATGNGTFNLDGGILEARHIVGGPGAGVFNFNGGQLRVAANPNADFMTGLTSANVKAGGAKIDTGSHDISIAQALLDGGGNGGLIKQGTGGLALLGANTYTGATLVNAGTLAGTGTIAGPVTVSSGATLAPGTTAGTIGTITINGALALNGGSTTSMEINKTLGVNDMVTGTGTVAYGGTLVIKNLSGQIAAGDVFTLFSTGARSGSFTNIVSHTLGQVVTWDTSNLTVDGTIKAATVVSTPPQISTVVTGGNITLSWPADQTGYTLEMQVNPLTIGISTNWTVVTGSTATNQMTFPVNVNNGSTFFRLLFP